jgi:hypothetical protein
MKLRLSKKENWTHQRKDVLGMMQLINAQDDGGKIVPFSPTDESLIMHFATSAARARSSYFFAVSSR